VEHPPLHVLHRLKSLRICVCSHLWSDNCQLLLLSGLPYVQSLQKYSRVSGVMFHARKYPVLKSHSEDGRSGVKCVMHGDGLSHAQQGLCKRWHRKGPEYPRVTRGKWLNPMEPSTRTLQHQTSRGVSVDVRWWMFRRFHPLGSCVSDYLCVVSSSGTLYQWRRRLLRLTTKEVPKRVLLLSEDKPCKLHVVQGD
jgi:hypothetical protein